MTGRLHVFVGSLNREAPYFQGARGVGISVLTFDEDTLRFEKIAETGDVDNPTYLSVHPGTACIYANSEVFSWREGTVSAYRFDPSSGALTYLNKQSSLGSITAYNSFSADGSKLMVANYAMGEGGPDKAVAVFGIAPDGALMPALSSIELNGTGPDTVRQERSHAHSVLRTLDGSRVLVADLGQDKILSYIPSADGALQAAGELQLPGGSGPRHMAMHPGGRFIFVTNELNSGVASIALQSDGAMSLIDVKPAVPDEARASNHCADIHVSPDGKFVYASNRGHDSIVAFAIDQESGALTLVGHTPSGGATPRNFAVTPSGRHLLVANQNGDSIVVFERDSALGSLRNTGVEMQIGTPVCVKVMEFS